MYSSVSSVDAESTILHLHTTHLFFSLLEHAHLKLFKILILLSSRAQRQSAFKPPSLSKA